MTPIPICADEKNRELINSNREEYHEIYQHLAFVEPEHAHSAEQKRAQLLTSLTTAGAILGCGGTKPYSRQLSPGCRLCVEGTWSCLFINGRCNLSCFYCPGPQNEVGQPTTNNLSFPSAADYVAYLEHFNFRGMSLSGGEPLLTLERSLQFLSAAKKHFGDKLHSWMYTNGSLINGDILGRLRDSGLDEIRFDCGALDYSLDQAALAVGRIATVTIEIPAVPEDLTRLQKKLHQMADCGIDFLNLHQLRLTAYNFPRFNGRPYTYLHGEKITVLESELAALQLINYAQEQHLQLPVNYCSFVYKNRYQKAAARARGGVDMGKSHEDLTAAGFLRSCSIKAEPQRLQAVASRLAEKIDPALWSYLPATGQLFFSAHAWPHIDFTNLSLWLSYAETQVSGTLSYRHPFREIKLPSGRKIIIERAKVAEFSLSPDKAQQFFQSLTATNETTQLPPETLPYEQLPTGLQSYF